MAFDGQFGGHVYSYSNALLGSRGKGTVSLPGRYDGLVLDGVNQLPDGNYVKNTHKTADITEYYGLAYAFQNAEQNFVSTQFLKLRELRLDYEFPKKWLSKTRIIKGLVLSVYGRDLFCWSDFPAGTPRAPSCAARRSFPASRSPRCPEPAPSAAVSRSLFNAGGTEK